MNEEKLIKWFLRSLLDNDTRPYASGEKEYFKGLIENARTSEQASLAFACALSHPFSS